LAKNLKLNIKNEQLAQAISLSKVKPKLAKKEDASSSASTSQEKATSAESALESKEIKEEAPRIKARSRSAFAEPSTPTVESVEVHSSQVESKAEPSLFHEDKNEENVARPKSTAELRRQIFGDESEALSTPIPPEPLPEPQMKPKAKPMAAPLPTESEQNHIERNQPSPPPAVHEPAARSQPQHHARPSQQSYPSRQSPQGDRLGPTGRHVKDYLPVKPKPPFPRSGDRPHPGGDRPPPRHDRPPRPHDTHGITRSGIHAAAAAATMPPKDKERRRPIKKEPTTEELAAAESESKRSGSKVAKAKEFRDIKPARKQPEAGRSFDVRDRHGLRGDEDQQQWRKRRAMKGRKIQEDTTIRPTTLAVRLPISVKDLASEMKLKASQLVAKLFMQGVAATINDLLEDEVTIQLLGQEFGCEISIDRKEENRIRITDKTIQEEIAEQNPEKLQTRAPVVAFMGHVDHGKTSLIDTIRKSNRVSSEAGAITQHIGAFRCSTPVGDIAILDTPGHEAFSAMRARGADVTDIVVIVIAGDEGIRQQTIEAINHAKAAEVTIVVAINKCDKPNFNAETVYRQLADLDLLPEAWGGQTITINCSATTGVGVDTLLEMLALQSEVLELKAEPTMRARGSVLESELHKGHGNVATVLVQNGMLRRGDALVFSQHWGRVKTMRNEYGHDLEVAGPSTPVEITGISGLPEAGEEFIVVKSEKEAREIAEARTIGVTQKRMLQGRKISMENLFQQVPEIEKKILNLILRSDVQGSLEALRTALEKIHSEKVDLNIIMAGIGEISESDVQMAETSKAAILGFHVQIEPRAETLIKQHGVRVYIHEIIYHAIDQVKALMADTLDKIAEEHERGVTEVKTIFKSSQHGVIAGCQVIEGTIRRSYFARVKRNNEVIWKGQINSLRREKEDVREVQKGFECGVLLNGFNDFQPGDLIETYEIIYKVQEL